MAAANEVTRLLDDIDARQQQVIDELDALIVRIEAVIAEWTEPGKKAPPAETAAASAPADPGLASEIPAEVSANAATDAQPIETKAA